jgi:hypothetical protein
MSFSDPLGDMLTRIRNSLKPKLTASALSKSSLSISKARALSARSSAYPSPDAAFILRLKTFLLFATDLALLSCQRRAAL